MIRKKKNIIENIEFEKACLENNIILSEKNNNINNEIKYKNHNGRIKTIKER